LEPGVFLFQFPDALVLLLEPGVHFIHHAQMILKFA
jgi:hypothetical protein